MKNVFQKYHATLVDLNHNTIDDACYNNVINIQAFLLENGKATTPSQVLLWLLDDEYSKLIADCSVIQGEIVLSLVNAGALDNPTTCEEYSVFTDNHNQIMDYYLHQSAPFKPHYSRKLLQKEFGNYQKNSSYKVPLDSGIRKESLYLTTIVEIISHIACTLSNSPNISNCKDNLIGDEIQLFEFLCGDVTGGLFYNMPITFDLLCKPLLSELFEALTQIKRDYDNRSDDGDALSSYYSDDHLESLLGSLYSIREFEMDMELVDDEEPLHTTILEELEEIEKQEQADGIPNEIEFPF